MFVFLSCPLKFPPTSERDRAFGYDHYDHFCLTVQSCPRAWRFSLLRLLCYPHKSTSFIYHYRAAVKRSKLETLVASLYGSLSKRIPPSTASPANIKTMASWLFSWWADESFLPKKANSIVSSILVDWLLNVFQSAMSVICSPRHSTC